MAQLGDSQEFDVTVSFFSKASGAPASVQSDSIAWSVTDPAVLNVIPGDYDAALCEAHAVVQAVGPLGTAAVVLAADADLGEGVKTITGQSEDVQIVTGEATGMTFGFGAPRPKSEAPA